MKRRLYLYMLYKKKKKYIHMHLYLCNKLCALQPQETVFCFLVHKEGQGDGRNRLDKGYT